MTFLRFIAVVCSMIFLGMAAYGKIVLNLPTLKSNDIQPGNTIEFELENMGTEPSTFFPLLQHFEGPGDVLLSKEKLYAWLQKDCEDIHLQKCREQAINRLAMLIKGDRFLNRSFYLTFADDDDMLACYTKAYSYPASLLSTYSFKCSDFATIARSILCDLGWENNQIRIINGYNHTLLEVKNEQGNWVAVDFDPSMPMLLTCNKRSAEEMMSLLNSKDYNREINYWYFKSSNQGNITSLNRPHDWDTYFLRAFGDVSVLEPIQGLSKNSCNEFTGEISIPSGSRLSAKIIDDALWYRLTIGRNYRELSDLNLLSKSVMLLIYRGYYLDALQYGNKLVSQIAYTTNAEMDKVIEAIRKEKIEFTYSDIWYPVFGKNETPFYTITLPPGRYELGKELKAPGKVLSIVGGIHDTLYLKDSFGNDTIITGKTNFQIAVSGFDKEVEIQNNALYYLQSGYAHVTDSMKIDVSWNPAVFNFLHGTLTIDELGDPDTLQFKYWVNGEMML